MLTGRFQLAAPGAKRRQDRLSSASAPRDGRADDGAAWTQGAAWLPGDAGAPSSATATRARWARSTSFRPVSPGRSPASTTRAGPDADDPELTLEVWRDRIRRHPGELKSSCGTRRLSPDRQRLQRRDPARRAAEPVPPRSSLAPEEVDALYEATRQPSRARSRSCGSASRRRSRSRSATSWPSTCAAARPVPLRHAPQRGQLSERGDVVVPRLPALTARCRARAVRDLQDLSDAQDRVERDPVEVRDRVEVVPNCRDPAQRVTRHDAVVFGTSASPSVGRRRTRRGRRWRCRGRLGLGRGRRRGRRCRMGWTEGPAVIVVSSVARSQRASCRPGGQRSPGRARSPRA